MEFIQFLYFTIAIGVIVGIILLGYITFILSRTLNTVNSVLKDVKETTSDISMVKETLKLGLLSFITGLISKKGR